MILKVLIVTISEAAVNCAISTQGTTAVCSYFQVKVKCTQVVAE